MNATTRFANVKTQNKIVISTNELQSILSCGKHSAVRIGEAAEARVQIGRRLFWNVEKIRTYIDLISS